MVHEHILPEILFPSRRANSSVRLKIPQVANVAQDVVPRDLSHDYAHSAYDFVAVCYISRYWEVSMELPTVKG